MFGFTVTVGVWLAVNEIYDNVKGGPIMVPGKEKEGKSRKKNKYYKVIQLRTSTSTSLYYKNDIAMWYYYAVVTNYRCTSYSSVLQYLEKSRMKCLNIL